MLDEVFAVRATAHRIAMLAGVDAPHVRAEADGWCRLDRDPRAVGAATRAVGCVLRLEDERTLRVTAYGPDGSVGEGADACRIARLPGGDELLRTALSHPAGRYSPRTRLADACRALGVPPALLRPHPHRAVPPAAGTALPTGVVLVGAAVRAAAAGAARARQSAWTVPVAARWSLHLWDGAGRPAPPVAAARALGARRPAVACWWSPEAAGLVVVHQGRPAAGHEWGGRAPVTPETAARAGRLLAAAFGVPDRAVALTALLRRRDLTPPDAVAGVPELLGLPAAMIGRATAAELAAWAATVPDAMHSGRPGR